MKEKRKNYKLWFYSEKPLDKIAAILYDEKVIGKFHYDYENVFEWVEAQSVDLSFEINISRKHSYWNGFEEGSIELKKENLKEPISIMLLYDVNEPADKFIEEMAHQIHFLMNCSVYLGTINYLKGDDFEYIKTEEILKK